MERTVTVTQKSCTVQYKLAYLPVLCCEAPHVRRQLLNCTALVSLVAIARLTKKMVHICTTPTYSCPHAVLSLQDYKDDTDLDGAVTLMARVLAKSMDTALTTDKVELATIYKDKDTDEVSR